MMDILNTLVVQAKTQTPTEERAEIFAKLSELEQALILLHPTMPVLLQKIHKQLKEDPAICTILTEEQIAIIFQALERQTNTILMEASAPKTKKIKGADIKADDL